VEKNGASKDDGTNIQMKIGYSKRPDFDSRRGGLGQTKSGKFLYFILLCFFLSPTRRGGWKKTVLRNMMALIFK
jgi:hypothetical protein